MTTTNTLKSTLIQAALDKVTSEITAMRTYAELCESCKTGYVPTLLAGPRQDALAAALTADGFKVWRGSNG